MGGALWLGVLLASACARPPVSVEETVEPIRVSDAVGLGDPARRASMRLVVQGLDADEAGETGRAQGSYERAVQVDATNPYVYLALARHHLDGSDIEHATYLIDQAAALFEAEGMREPRVGVHLIGLRGRAMQMGGQSDEADLYLERAGAMAPTVWGDAYLSAGELR
jgi:hypothetical protein